MVLKADEIYKRIATAPAYDRQNVINKLREELRQGFLEEEAAAAQAREELRKELLKPLPSADEIFAEENRRRSQYVPRKYVKKVRVEGTGP